MVWHSQERELWSGEDTSVEVNEDLLADLIQFYLNKPNKAYAPVADKLEDVKNDYNRGYMHNVLR